MEKENLENQILEIKSILNILTYLFFCGIMKIWKF